MKLYGEEKPFFICSSGYNISCNQRLSNNFQDVFYSYGGTKFIYFKKSNSNNIVDDFKNKLYKGPIGNVVYFHPQSKYPRFKLQGTRFKRTIKPERADVIVVPEEPIVQEYTYGKTKIYEDENSKALYAISESILQQFFRSEDDFLNSCKRWSSISLKYKETTTIVRIPKQLEYLLDIVYNTYNKSIITDKMLDIEVSRTLDTMTEEDINSIDAMLSSTDKSVIELGLKTLAGFNVFKTPNIIKTLLFKNFNNVINNKAVDTVIVRKLLNSIDFPRSNYIGTFPNWVFNLVDKDEKLSDFENTQIKKLLVPLFKYYFDAMFSKFTGTNSLPSFIPKLKYTIE